MTLFDLPSLTINFPFHLALLVHSWWSLFKIRLIMIHLCLYIFQFHFIQAHPWWSLFQSSFLLKHPNLSLFQLLFLVVPPILVFSNPPIQEIKWCSFYLYFLLNFHFNFIKYHYFHRFFAHLLVNLKCLLCFAIFLNLLSFPPKFLPINLIPWLSEYFLYLLHPLIHYL